MLTALGKGMRDAAERAGIAIVGGELSQHPDTLTGPREGYAFDISATCVGVLEDGAAAITGAAVRPGDAVIGMASNGIHANGLTLARSVLLGGDAHESVGLVLPGVRTHRRRRAACAGRTSTCRRSWRCCKPDWTCMASRTSPATAC